MAANCSQMQVKVAAALVPSGSLEDHLHLKDEWRYATVMSGEQFVMISGVLKMHKSFVGS